MKPTVEAKNICFNYHSLDGETEAIKDLSFTVEKGEFVSIVGPSGCGKARQSKIQQNGAFALICRASINPLKALAINLTFRR